MFFSVYLFLSVESAVSVYIKLFVFIIIINGLSDRRTKENVRRSVRSSLDDLSHINRHGNLFLVYSQISLSWSSLVHSSYASQSNCSYFVGIERYLQSCFYISFHLFDLHRCVSFFSHRFSDRSRHHHLRNDLFRCSRWFDPSTLSDAEQNFESVFETNSTCASTTSQFAVQKAE